MGPGAKTPYYTLVSPNLGEPYVRGTDRSQDYQAVFLGVEAIQSALNRRGAKLAVDGWYGKLSDQAARAFQSRAGLTADGYVGPATMRKLLDPDISAAVIVGVSLRLLRGIAIKESGLDPGAVGCVDPDDLGTCQLHRLATSPFTVEQAFDPPWALRYTALRLQAVGIRYDVGLGYPPLISREQFQAANHNWPSGAATWAKTGVAPLNKQSGEYLDEYVRLVLAAGGTAT
jgi:hypothetical protein